MSVPTNTAGGNDRGGLAIDRLVSALHRGQMPKLGAATATRAGLTIAGYGGDAAIGLDTATTALAGAQSAADKAALDLLANPPRARLDVTVNKAITSGALNAVAFDSATYVSAGASGGATPWTAGANTKFIVPAGGAGGYEYLVEVDFAGSAAGTTRAAYVRVNGAAYVGGGFMLPTAAGPVVAAAGEYSLVAGDYVEIVPYQDAGVAVNVTAAHAHFRRVRA